MPAERRHEREADETGFPDARSRRAGGVFSLLARATEPSKDQGIGGTGWTAGTDGDQGIGGTGIVGTIQRFGSIFVNGVRVQYQPDVPVWIDDVPVAPNSLKIGHIVRVAVVQRPIAS